MANTNTAGAYRAPTLEEERERLVQPIKEFRKEVYGLIQRVTRPRYDRESVARQGELVPHNNDAYEASQQAGIHLTNAKMWAGKILEGLGNPFPPELADKANVP
jgi:hypothetical protein